MKKDCLHSPFLYLVYVLFLAGCGPNAQMPGYTCDMASVSSDLCLDSSGNRIDCPARCISEVYCESGWEMLNGKCVQLPPKTAEEIAEMERLREELQDRCLREGLIPVHIEEYVGRRPGTMSTPEVNLCQSCETFALRWYTARFIDAAFGGSYLLDRYIPSSQILDWRLYPTQYYSVITKCNYDIKKRGGAEPKKGAFQCEAELLSDGYCAESPYDEWESIIAERMEILRKDIKKERKTTDMY